MTSVLQVVDSSGWIEVFTDGPLAERFLEVLQDEHSLMVRSPHNLRSVQVDPL